MLYWTFIYWKQVIIINGPNPNFCLYVFGCMQSFSATISGTKQSQKVLAAIQQILWNWNKMLSKALSQLFRQTGVFTQFCDIYQSSNILVCISVIESAAVNTESDLSIKQPFWSRSSLQPTLWSAVRCHISSAKRKQLLHEAGRCWAMQRQESEGALADILHFICSYQISVIILRY